MAEYGLEHLEAELAARWTRETDRFTLRELESWFNARLVESAMRAAGMDPLESEPENVRRLLVDDGVAANEREQCRQRLAGAGVDVDSLRGDFVTYNSIYSLLAEDKGIEPPSDDEPRPERVKRRFRRLRERTNRVIEDGLSTVGDGAADVEPRVTFAVHCEACGHRMPALDFVDNGGCEVCLED